MRFLSINAVLVVLMTNDYGGKAMIAASPRTNAENIVPRDSQYDGDSETEEVVIPAGGGSLLRSVGGEKTTRRPRTSRIKWADEPSASDETGVVSPNDLRIRKLRILREPGKGLRVFKVPD